MKHGLESIGLLNIRRNSMSATPFSSAATSSAIAVSVASSSSVRASAKSSALSPIPVSIRVSVPTTSSSAFFSLPSSCARFGSSQIFGSSSSRVTSTSRVDFASKSKIPPQIGGAYPQIRKRGGDLVQLFGFHGRHFSLRPRRESAEGGARGRIAAGARREIGCDGGSTIVAADRSDERRIIAPTLRAARHFRKQPAWAAPAFRL
jgi:hypothetical protein